MTNRLATAYFLVAAMLLASCGGGGGGETATIASQPPSGTGVALVGNTLSLFSPSAPGTFTSVVALSGLDAGYTLATIDYRPATGQLYGIAINGVNGKLYSINAASGLATAVSGTDFSTTLTGTLLGSDFNPLVDRIRLVTETGVNMRVNPITGAIAGTDTPLTLGPSVHAIAYKDNVVGASLTTLYGIDSTAATLVLIGGVNSTPSPNGGVVSTVGALGVTPGPGTDIGFDIAPSDVAYAAITVGAVPNLYKINLATGSAALVGPFAPGTLAVRDLAIVP